MYTDQELNLQPGVLKSSDVLNFWCTGQCPNKLSHPPGQSSIFNCIFCTEAVSDSRKAYRNQSLEHELGILGLKFATETIAND